MKPSQFGSPYQQLVSTYIQSIAALSDRTVYFTDGSKVFEADFDGPGKARLLKTSGTTILQVLPVENGIWYSDVNAKIWLENLQGAVLKKHDFSSYGGAVFHLMPDKAGNLWACQDANTSLICITSDNQIKQYGISKGITSRPLSTSMNAKGIVYAGGMADSAFLFEFDQVLDRFKNLSKPLLFERNIDININDLVCNNDGAIWLGTSFGLIKYEKGTFTRIQTGEMTPASVKAVAIDRNNNVWFGNSMGLHQMVGDELFSFDERAGMTSKSINYRCIYIDNKNRIWAGTVSGLVISSPIAPPDKTTVPIIINLLINNEYPINYQPTGTTLNARSFITVKLGIPDFPAKYLKVERMLIGHDTAWIPVNKSNEILLVNLDPGKYKLLVRAKQYGNYLYSEPLTWEFTVDQSWYLQWWVILIGVLILLTLFWIGLGWNTNKLKRSNEKLESAISERTREIIIQKEKIESQHKSIRLKNEELEKANSELQSAKARAEEASDTKSKFLSVMTHELRTPMNAVIGYTHLLIQNTPRQDQLDDLKTLRFSAENLLALINNILDFNKIEAEKISLEKIEFNLRNMIEEIKSTMMFRAKHKNISLLYYYDPMLPEVVIGDPLRLSQIMNNLLSNALKFTEKGSVIIDLKLNSKTGNNVLVDFTITDTGIGIETEALNSIFDAFTQASSETSRKFGGTGLGLAITRRLLELYESKIHVKSEPGKGTSFTFTISFNEAANPLAIDRSSEEAYPFHEFSKQSVLLVEDNKVNRVIATKFLTSWNLNVEIANNGILAVEKIRQQPFDLILMDLQMPEMDGYQAAAAIRKFGVEPYITIPIIALTASSKADVYENIFISGMNDFISKPFNPIELHEKITKYLK